MPAPVFYLIAALVLLGAPTYVAIRLLSATPWPRIWKFLGWAAIEMTVLSTAIMMNLRYRFPGKEADFALRLSYLALGFFCLLFTWTLLRDLIWAPLRFTRIKQSARRQFWVRRSSAWVVVFTLVTLSIGVWQALKTPSVVEVTITVENFPPRTRRFPHRPPQRHPHQRLETRGRHPPHR